MVRTKREMPPARKRNSMTSRVNRIKGQLPCPDLASTTSANSAANVKVIVRVRPPNSREQGENFRTVVKVINDEMLVFDPKEEDEGFFYHGTRQRRRDLLKKPNKELTFMFDKVFDGGSTTQNIFLASTHSLIENLMNGYNCSVFAYGATGAGKTHTMTGNEEFPGITFLTMTELFKKQEELASEREFELGITYLEVYNELVKDLLNPGSPLNIREDTTYGVTVAGIKMFKISHSDELFKLLIHGNKNRTQHPTDANAESSRSHAVFQVYIQMIMKGTNEVRRAKLSMIDLAGSERGSATNFSGARFVEGANINKSLLALGNCINGLADGHRHIPYRDSKLTRLLKDSLGGNCYTVMIANISPSSLSFEDTYNTLKYATRAKKIKSQMKKNVTNLQMHAEQYMKINEELKAKNNSLQAQLTESKQNALIMQKEIEHLKSKIDDFVKTQPVKKVERNEEVLKDIENLLQHGLDLIEKEYHLHCDKDLITSKRTFKEENFKLVSDLCISPKKQDTQKRLQLVIDRFKKEEEDLNKQLEMVKKAKEDFISKLNHIQEEHPTLVDVIGKGKFEMLAKQDRMACEYEKKQCAIMLRRHNETQTLLQRTSAVLQFCFKQLHGHDLVSSNLRKIYEDIVSDLEEKSVTFLNAAAPPLPVPPPLSSVIGSTTCVTSTTNEAPPKGQEDTKRVEDRLNLNLTFTPSNSSTPVKSKARICVEAISKVRTPCAIKKVGRTDTLGKSPRRRGILKKVDVPSLANRPRFKF